MRTPRLFFCAALSGALCLGAGALHAQEEDAQRSDAALADGRARFAEGIALAERGEHAAATLKFRQAWVVVKAPSALFNLARSEQLAGYRVDALRHFREFVKLSDPKIAPWQRKLAEQNIAELTKKVGHIDIQAPPGARVLVDGQRVEGELDEPIPVAPGEHVVSAVVDGEEISVTVECAAGTAARAKLMEDAADPQGSLAYDALDAGVTRGESTRSALGWAVPIGLGVAGLGAFGAGVAFSAAADASKERYESLERPGLCADPSSAGCSEYRAQHETATSERTAAVAGFVGGGVLVAAAVAAFALWPKRASTIHVAPAIGADGGGATIHVAF